MTQKNSLEKYLGNLMKNLPEVHNLEYNIGFSFHVNTFFQKLISREIIEKGVRIKADDFYKGIAFLDYYRLFEGEVICDKLIELSKLLRKKEKEDGEDGEMSYLPIDLVIMNAGLYSKQQMSDYINKKSELKDSFKPIELTKKADIYYEAIGKMVSDLVSDERKDILYNSKSRNDLLAIIFSDSIISYLKDESSKKEIINQLANGDYLDASISSLEALRNKTSLEEASKKLEKIFNENDN